MADTKDANKEYAAWLREKFSAQGGAALSDSQLLCLLLSFTNVKNNLTEVGAALEERFGGADGCYRASYSELMAVTGMTRHAAVIVMLIGRLAMLRGKNNVRAQSSQEYEEQFLTLLKYTMREELWAAALDDDGAVCSLERLASGSEVSVELSAGALMRFVVRSGAKRVVIAHAHPDATVPEQSETDIYSKKYLADALNAAGVTLVGQVIIAGGKARTYQV